MSSCCGILTHDVLVDGSPKAVLNLQLGVHSVRLELAPLVDVPVGRCEGDGEEADDEKVAQEPEICGDLTREMAPFRSSHSRYQKNLASLKQLRHCIAGFQSLL